MKITWTNQNTQYELAVRWRNAKENSLGSRIATLVDLKRASEVAGMLHDYVDRDEAFEREQKLKVRIAALEAEHDAYLDALAVDGCRPATVLAGIESLKTECANGRLTSAEEAIRSLARARATAHAAGYAEAVADVVEMMRDHVRRAENVMRKSHFDRGPFDASTLQAGAYVRGATWALDRIDSGAHVGAAKKGGS